MRLKLIAIFLIFTVILGISIVTYFKGNRDAILNSSINQLFEKYPSFRWGTREILVSIENLILIPLAIYYSDKDTLPSYTLVISESNRNQLLQNLPEPKPGNILIAQYKKEVPATIIKDNIIYDAEVRFRGDNYNHWAFQKKSWRIKLVDDDLDGMDEFDLIIPGDRMFVQELFSFRLAQRLGLITPKAYFVTLRVNGSGKRTYLLIQQWSNILIEQNKRPVTGLLVGESEKMQYLYKTVFGTQSFGQGNTKVSDLSSIEYLFNLLDEDDAEFYTNLPTILDMDSTLKWIAHSTVMFSRSQKDTHNLVVYINSSTGKIELIPWNVTMLDDDPKNIPIDTEYNLLVTRILKNPEWKKIRDNYVLELISDKNQLREDLAWIDHIKNQVRPAVLNDKDRRSLFVEYELQINKFKDRYQQAFYKLSEEFKQ